MWFIGTVYKTFQIESHGETLEEIPGEELMMEIGDSGDMPDSEAKTDENSGDQTDSPAEIPDEELTDQIGDSGDAPNFAAETDEISTETEVLSPKTLLMKMVGRFRLVDPDFMQEIIKLIIAVFLSPPVVIFVLRALSQMEPAVILMDVVHVNGTGFRPNDCNITCQQESFFAIISAYPFVGPHKTVCSFESPHHTATGRPAVITGMNCKRKECGRKNSGHCAPVTRKPIERILKYGHNTTEFLPDEGCCNWYDSRAAQLTLSYGFRCDDGVSQCGYNTSGFRSAEAMCDSCAALLTLTFLYDCDDGVFKYGCNAAGSQSAEPMNDLRSECRGRWYIQPVVVEHDGEVYFVRVEVLLSESGDDVSLRVSSSVSVDCSGSTKRNASEKCDGRVALWPRFSP